MKLKNTFYILLFSLFLVACSVKKEVVIKSNGVVEKNGFLDSDSLKTGMWKIFYPNGNIHKKRTYNNGKLHGKATVYYLSGQLRYIKNFKNGLKHGKFKGFYEYGNKLSEERFKEGKQFGEQKMFYKNGQLRSKRIYDKNHRNVGIKKYFKSGEPWVSMDLNKNGNGTSVEFNTDGQIIEKRKFENYNIILYKKFYDFGEIKEYKKLEYDNGDVVTTLTRDYNPDGKLIKEELRSKEQNYIKTFGDSINSFYPMERYYKQGLFKSHYHNGQIAEIGHYERDWKDGRWKSYYSDGTLKFTGKFVPENPQLKDSIHTYYFPSGQIKKIEFYETVKSEHTNNLLTNKIGTWKVFYPNGQLKKSTDYKGEGSHKQGDYRSYYNNGNLKEEGTYHESYLKGDYKYYYENGNLKVHIHNVSLNLRDGLVETYYKDGTLESKIYYKNNIQDGKAYKYFENGNIRVEGVYELGNDETGKWKYFYKTGGLAKEVLYTDEEKIFSFFYPNGEKMAVIRNYRLDGTTQLKNIKLFDKSGAEIGFSEFASIDKEAEITSCTFYYGYVMGDLNINIEYRENGKEKTYEKMYK